MSWAQADDYEDYGIPRSPTLQALKVSSEPEPAPSPFTQQIKGVVESREQGNRDPGSKRRMGGKPLPTQGDAVLISILAPNHPEIARQAGERALRASSFSEGSEDEMGEDERTQDAVMLPQRASNGDREGTATRTEPLAKSTAHTSTVQNAASPLERIEVAAIDKHPAQNDSSEPVHTHQEADRLPPMVHQSSIACDVPKGPVPVEIDTPQRPSNDLSPQTLRTTEDNEGLEQSRLRGLAIPRSLGPESEKLPAIQIPSPSNANDGQTSPVQERLPSFHQMEMLANRAHKAASESSPNGYIPHRQSFSASNGPQLPQSPTFSRTSGRPRSVSNQLPPISSHTSPLTEHSPMESMKNALSPPSVAGAPTPQYTTNRRPSLASESGRPPYLAPLTSGSSGESMNSHSTYSPGSQSQSTHGDTQAHRMSIDGLVQPNGMGPMAPGNFKCDFPDCNAPSFTTQYLLNSHMNVHSSNRPHYCPEPGCPRGREGKGFKRKNEMIRHGLVHRSPGYVCPFCPDREHKYPRPDNLQRHVRVHHVDRDKDDPALRDVLAQRPEGGSRGRRRRGT